MDFELSPVQQALSSTLDRILARHLSSQRARELIEGNDYDDTLEAQLREAGYFDLFADGADAGPLDAVLAVERLATALASVSTVAHLVVLPALGITGLTGAAALAVTGSDQPVRYGPQARTVVRVGTGSGTIADRDPSAVAALPTVYGYPLARLAGADDRDPRPISAQLGTRAADWWRVGLAAEAVGLMRAALDVAVQYAKDRSVFGVALGSFQALQHRLAECSIAVEGARWLVYEAAASGAPS
jgi:alkylation response protein AidB-like acyl-CoA dehydrogenase